MWPALGWNEPRGYTVDDADVASRVSVALSAAAACMTGASGGGACALLKAASTCFLSWRSTGFRSRVYARCQRVRCRGEHPSAVSDMLLSPTPLPRWYLQPNAQ
eukprot:m.975499 g.975499  ORF g.975499 m.975499 type:complete len:104 (-) comp23941_c0_seq2:2805-3116(-)